MTGFPLGSVRVIVDGEELWTITGAGKGGGTATGDARTSTTLVCGDSSIGRKVEFYVGSLEPTGDLDLLRRIKGELARGGER